MGIVIVKTEFNKTGVRRLTTPLNEERVSRPAKNVWAREQTKVFDRRKSKLERAKQRYVSQMSEWLAKYVSSDSTSNKQRFIVTKFLTEQALLNTYPSESHSWSTALSSIKGFGDKEKVQLKKYSTEFQAIQQEYEVGLNKALGNYLYTRSKLWREVFDAITSKV